MSYSVCIHGDKMCSGCMKCYIEPEEDYDPDEYDYEEEEEEKEDE